MIKDLETKLKDSSKKVTELEDSSKGSMRTNLELDRVKRDKNNLDAEVVKLKDQAIAEKRKCEKMERDMVSLSDKVEKAQREVIGVEREKRRMEEEKNKIENQVSRLEGDLRSITREKDRFKDEAEAARQKNRENLSQTQEGMKAFKDQIESLKQELTDEKGSISKERIKLTSLSKNWKVLPRAQTLKLRKKSRSLKNNFKIKEALLGR